MTREQYITDVISIIKKKGLVYGTKTNDLVFKDDHIDNRQEEAVRNSLFFIKDKHWTAVITAFEEAEVGSSYYEVLSKLEDEGCLSTDTMITTAGDGVSLVLGHRHFLHWFRGYNFQVSGDVYGVGSRHNSSKYLENDLRKAAIVGNDFFNMVYFSHFCEIAFKYDKLRKAIGGDPALVNEFMRSTLKDASPHLLSEREYSAYSFDVLSVLTNIKIDKLPSPPVETCTFVETDSATDDGLFSHIYLGKDYVGLQLYGNGESSYITFPDVDNLLADEDIEAKFEWSNFDRIKYMRMAWEKAIIVLSYYNDINLHAYYVSARKHKLRMRDTQVIANPQYTTLHEMQIGIGSIAEKLYGVGTDNSGGLKDSNHF